MPATVGNALIVGGGLIGLLTAIELRRAGVEVEVLERSRPAGESSWAGGGILSPLYPWRYPAAVRRLAAWSQARYPALLLDLQARSGIDPEFRQTGLLILDAGRERADARAWLEEDGRWHRWLRGEALREVQEGLQAASGERALWLPWVAQVRNPRFGRALAAAAEALGVRIRRNAPARLLSEADGAVAVACGGEVLRAERVVVAGGAWSDALLATLGLHAAIRPVRGQMLVLRARPGQVRPILLFDEGRYLIPRRDGRVLLGSTMEEAGFDKSTTLAAREALLAAAARVLPRLADCPVERHWSGLRPGSPSGVPAIGAVPGWRNLYINAGHFRNGVVMGPASARLLADLILDREPILDPAPYRPECAVGLRSG